MERQFEKQKTKEIVKRKKYIPKSIFAGLVFLTIVIALIIGLVTLENGTHFFLCTLTLIITIMSTAYFAAKTDDKITETINNYVETEKQKKINETFISYKGIREEDVNRALKSIVFEEWIMQKPTPTQEEIDRINKITKALNEIQEEDKLLQESYLFDKQLEIFINNLWHREYAKVDEDFEEKQKQRLDRIIKEHELKLKTPPTDESIRSMYEKCNEKLNEQSSIRLSYYALSDITQHLKKIVYKNERVREEERIKISSVVNEIIKLAKEYEKPKKMQIETKIKEKLADL